MKKFFLAFMIMVLLCPCSFAAENDDFSQKLAGLEREIEYLQKKISDLSIQLNNADINNMKNYHSLCDRISRRDDFVFCLVFAMNILFIGLPVLLTCLTWCQENRAAKKLIDFMHESFRKNGNENK